MNSSDPLGARARFLAAVDKAAEYGGRPTRLCEACVLSLPVQRAGIAVHLDGVGLEVLCASDDLAERVEWAQVGLGEGPAWAAIASGGPVIAADLAEVDERWPVFSAEASAAGIGSMFAVPLQIGAIKVGVLDLYRDNVQPFDPQDFADAVAVADLVTTILLTIGRTGRITEPLGPWWDQPVGTREVHQATGMIMAQLGIDAKDAYVRLQAFAYATQCQTRDVAHEVVGRRLRFDPDPDPDPFASRR